MPVRRTFPIAALVVATLPGAWRPHPGNVAHELSAWDGLALDACTLLTTDEVSTALEVPAQPGKHVVASSTMACIWSTDAASVASGRRVTVSISTLIGFNMAKTRPMGFTVEPVSGVGDEAYYEVFRADSPFLVVRKGTVVFTVRVLNGGKLKAFDLDQEKAKELTLAKAAAGRT